MTFYYSSSASFPFSNISNAELFELFNYSSLDNNDCNYDLRKILTESLTEDVTESLEFKYYTPSQLNNLADGVKPSFQLTMYHVNVRSLNKNYNKLINFFQCLSFQFDVIGLSDIWSTNINHYINLFTEYDFFFDSSKTRLGGVGIYIKKSFNAYKINKLKLHDTNNSPCTYESVLLEFCIDNCITVVGGFYRHPNTSIKDFNDDFLDILDKLKNVKRCYILGDFNVCLSHYSSNAATRLYVDTILDAKFLPYVFLPTRLTNHSSTIIDHVYTNDIFIDNHLCKTGLVIGDIADHCANFMFVLDKKIKSNPSPFTEKIRNFSQQNIDKFNSCLMTTNWNPVYSCIDPNEALNRFITKVTLLHDHCFNFITIKSKNCSEDKKWITPGLVKSINHKCKLYKRWIKTKRHNDELKYKLYQKTLRKTLFAAEKLYYTKLFDTRAHTSKNIWKNINSLINYKQPKFTKSLKIVRDGIKLEEPLKIANVFNNYFCEVAERLSNTNNNSTNTNNISFESLKKHQIVFILRISPYMN